MRRTITALVLTLSLVGCGSLYPPWSPAPIGSRALQELDASGYKPGKPFDLGGGDPSSVRPCGDTAEGLLVEGVVVDTYLSGFRKYPTTVELVRQLNGPGMAVGAVRWPPGVDPSKLVPLAWPAGYSGLQLASGEVEVRDGAGQLVATTGKTYRLRGEVLVIGATGGPRFPHSWIAGFTVCGDDGSVIPG